MNIVLKCSALGEKMLPWIINISKNLLSFRVQDMSKLKLKYTSSAKPYMKSPIIN